MPQTRNVFPNALCEKKLRVRDLASDTHRAFGQIKEVDRNVHFMSFGVTGKWLEF